MLVSFVRRLRARRDQRLDTERGAVPRGVGWDRLANDPTFDFTRRMSESPGGQPPRVHWRERG
ncbi:MAG TPA: hypothetical protein VNP92_10745 [Actinophytocola sp.]|nr:hypothetical protein [Actinophytocola sp.]